MRHSILTVFSCLIFFSTFSQNNKRYQVKGRIDGLTCDTLVYLVLNASRDTIGKTYTHNGEFIFNGYLSTSIEWASLRIDKADKWPTFFLENKTLAILGTITQWPLASIEGSIETTHNRKLNESIGFLESEYNIIQMEKRKAFVAKDSNQISLFKQREKQIIDSFLILKESFINEHNNVAYTAWLIQNAQEFNLERKQQEYAKLTLFVQQSNFGLQLKQHIQELQLQSTIKPGAIVPNFKLQTPEGILISLNEVLEKNELTLLDFWASWCTPCREMTPELRRIYESFREKGFTILSISSDRNKEAWKKAISTDSMSWAHATPVKGYEDPNSIFDIHVIPAYVLLDKVGRILAIDNPMSSIASFGFAKERDTEAIFTKVSELLSRRILRN